MGYRRDTEPSPLRTGLAHASMSLVMFGGLAAAFGLGIHVIGDPAAAGPRQNIALFNAPATDIAASQGALTFAQAGFDAEDIDADDAEADAGFALVYSELDADALRIDITGGQGGPATVPAAGIRINGRLVQPGQSFGEVSAGAAATAASADIPELTLTTARKSGPASKAPADVNARPFSNPEGRPMVALVIGGLGINTTQTRLAIDALPAEVTLSFAPDARQLDYWVRTARADGHEVLIEVPMEAFEYGRMRMHPDTLIAGADKPANLARLNKVLGRASGYFGVINYQGAKFGADTASLEPVLRSLSERGLAFIDDGSVQRAAFGEVAAETGLRFARAAGPIDTRQTPQDIAAELMELETLALRDGAAFGAGFAFPVTIEAASVWIETLDEKGLILAPVSALVPQVALTPAPAAVAGRRELRTGSLEKTGLKTGG
ncbi:MAG: divergent polysaccharide deacetylase family protein [Hyphomonas sp.]